MLAKPLFDVTFTHITDNTKAQRAHLALHLQRKDTDLLHKVTVTDDVTKEITSYIVSKPFTNNHIFPVGTRCFNAYDCQTGAIVLLKDTWRVDNYEREGCIYRELHKAHVRNIAAFITAGDVGYVCGQTKNFSDVPEEKRPRVHYHYRLVLGTIGTSLTHFPSTWHLVNAATSALIGNVLFTSPRTLTNKPMLPQRIGTR